MRFDPRQVLSAFLTFSMFFMLANMIKRDHFDYPDSNFPPSMPKISVERVQKHNKDAWMGSSSMLKPCWNKPSSMLNQSNGYVTFSLTIGPEHHLSQITDAVVVARYLKASLVVPDIRGSRLDQKMNFEDMYDAQNFIESLEGAIQVVKQLPAEVAASQPAVVRVPNRVSEDYIRKNIEPLFRVKSYLKLAVFFPWVDLIKKEKKSDDLDSVSCMAMFTSLKLNPSVQQVADAMVEKLRALSQKSDGKFIAVDLRAGVLETKSCKAAKSNGLKSCYDAKEVAGFLKGVGFSSKSTVYVTQTWWHDSLNAIKESFPATYTKDDIMPADKKGDYLKSSELARALDLYVCAQGDVFVPAISGLFKGNVIGKRIAEGRTQVMVPGEQSSMTASGTVSDYVSSYIREEKHWAYSCYCKG